jgi:formylglycine-generating enzyme
MCLKGKLVDPSAMASDATGMISRLIAPLLFLVTLSALSQEAPSSDLKLDLGGGMMLEVLWIKPGSFEQGSPITEAGREADESLRHVTLTGGFYMGKHPVTRGQFARFVAATSYRTEAEQGASGGFGVVDGKLVQAKAYHWRNPGFPQTDDHPVVLVTVKDAEAFCRWLTARVARDCMLPTEAQWEYACRAGTSSARYSSPVDAVSWHRGNSDGQTQPVGQKQPNAWGLQDLYGPVWQWCRDWYAPYPAGSAVDPLQTNANLSDKPRQVLRGGSFLSDVSHSRSAERYRNDARSRNADNGFRIVAATTKRPASTSGTPRPSAPERVTPPEMVREEPAWDAPAAPQGSFPWGFITLPVFAFFLFRLCRGILGKASGAVLEPRDLTPREAAEVLDSRPAPLAQRFAFRLTDSGFYIRGPAEAVGTQIEYTADVGARVITDSIVFSPGPEGQFIFTGMKPRGVSVRTTGGLLGTTGSLLNSSNDDFQGDWPRASSTTQSSYPSAY